MDDQIKISVIIVSYKNGEILKRTLDSIELFNDIGDELEVIVVDNSPQLENVEEYVIKSNLKNCKYIKADNKGFGASNNLGYYNSKGKILAFMNPDIILIEPIFKNIIDVLENEKIGIMGCKLLNENLNPNHSFFKDLTYSFFDSLLIHVASKYDIFCSKFMFTSGSDIFMRRKIFERIGKFDENIFMYHEELDLKKRLFKYAPEYKVVYNKNIRMIHLEGDKINGPSYDKCMIGYESLFYVGKKHNLRYRKSFRHDYNRNLLKVNIGRVLKRSSYDFYLEKVKAAKDFKLKNKI